MIGSNVWDTLTLACKYLIKEKRIQIFIDRLEYGNVYNHSYSGWSNTLNSSSPLTIQEHQTAILRLRIQHNFEVECWLYDDDFDLDKPCVIDTAARISSVPEEKRLVARLMYILWLIYKQTTSMKLPDSYLAVDGGCGFVWQRLRQITMQL